MMLLWMVENAGCAARLALLWRKYMMPLTLSQVTTNPSGLVVAVTDVICKTDWALVGFKPAIQS